ncbi:hypothetical protein FRC10_010545 [Ceratobasidium sp. 414]|nr:hypothetical protein FRC10_010545 [Ceratobasidium sp. 414]
MATPNEQAGERAPLLPSSHIPNTNGLPHADSDHAPEQDRRKHDVVKLTLSSVLTLLFVSAIVVVVTFLEEGMPRDPEKAALGVLENSPIIDGHIDLPELVRVVYKNNISSFDLRERMPAHVDIPRMRRGRVGGFFWSVYVSCKDDGPDFLIPTNRVRDTLEQIDVSKLLIQKYSDVRHLPYILWTQG